jgi:ribosome recycling factor
MGMVEDVLSQLDQEVSTALASMKSDLAKLRTGRASIALLDGVRVNYYGTATPLAQCANLTVVDARLITVKPWDRGLISEIEKAIYAAALGITPQNDGEVIRLPIPQLTEERRRDLVKQAKHRGEEAKIGVRNHRRDANEMLKELEKEKEISQDDLKKALEKVQDVVDRGVAKVEEILSVKEKEIMEI